MKTLHSTTQTASSKKFTSKLTVRSLSPKKSVISLLVISSLMATPSYAFDEANYSVTPQEKIEQADKNVEIGFGSGALVGALVAGPVGAFVAGLVGTFIAKNVNAENTIEDLEVTLASKQQNLDEVIALHQKSIQATEQSYQAELLSLEQNYKQSAQLQAENLLMSLQFSTGSSEIKPHYQQQVTALTQMLKQSPDLSVDLSGYTDLQGDEVLNHALSLARVNAVKNALIDGGVKSDRIQIFAHGETAPVVASNNKEVSFYDRRVVIKLHQVDHDQTASNF
jgi:sortase system peptidoglycan-associated protein